MKIKLSILLIAAGLLIIFADSCRREPDLTDYPEVKFSTEVLPVISANCSQSGCHSSGGGEVFPLTNYEQIIANVSPYKAYKSSLYRAITGRNYQLMPPAGPLNDDQIRSIFVWIEQGAPNN